MTDRKLLLRWAIANATGMALGFLVFIQTLMFLAFGLDFGLHWSNEVVENWEAENPEDAERLLRSLATESLKSLHPLTEEIDK